MKKLKVLIVDDDRDIQKRYEHHLKDAGIQIVSAYTLNEAWNLFQAHPDLSLIVMDACLVPRQPPTTLELVKKIREAQFSNSIIAASSDVGYRKQLLRAGCDCESEKWNVPKIVKEILNL
jgi:CheY-like chemotaxis protein